jgi:WD40 repeat protein
VVNLWDLETGKIIRTFPEYNSNIDALALSPDGTQFLSITNYDALRLWDMASGAPAGSLEMKENGGWKALYSPDGKNIAAVTGVVRNYTITIWDAASGRILRTLTGGHRAWITSISYSPDGRFLVSASEDGTIKIWDAAAGEEVQTLSGNGAEVLEAVFSPNGNQIASVSADGEIKIWALRFQDAGITARELRSIKGAPTKRIIFDPNNYRRLVSGSNNGIVYLWDLVTSNEIARFINLPGGEWICITPDGYYNASANGDRHLRVRVGDVVYGVERYRSVYKRPDIVASRLR